MVTAVASKCDLQRMTMYQGDGWSIRVTWWRHQMETFSVLLAICAGNSPVTGEFPAQRPVTRSFHVLFDFRLNKRLSKQSWGWWFDTPSGPLWRHCNGYHYTTRMVRVLFYIPHNIQYKPRQIPKFKYFLSRFAVVLAQSIEGRYWVENEDIIAVAPTGVGPTVSERSANLLPTKVRFILDVWRCVLSFGYFC